MRILLIFFIFISISCTKKEAEVKSVKNVILDSIELNHVDTEKIESDLTEDTLVNVVDSADSTEQEEIDKNDNALINARLEKIDSSIFNARLENYDYAATNKISSLSKLKRIRIRYNIPDSCVGPAEYNRDTVLVDGGHPFVVDKDTVLIPIIKQKGYVYNLTPQKISKFPFTKSYHGQKVIKPENGPWEAIAFISINEDYWNGYKKGRKTLTSNFFVNGPINIEEYRKRKMDIWILVVLEDYSVGWVDMDSVCYYSQKDSAIAMHNKDFYISGDASVIHGFWQSDDIKYDPDFLPEPLESSPGFAEYFDFLRLVKFRLMSIPFNYSNNRSEYQKNALDPMILKKIDLIQDDNTTFILRIDPLRYCDIEKKFIKYTTKEVDECFRLKFVGVKSKSKLKYFQIPALSKVYPLYYKSVNLPE